MCWHTTVYRGVSSVVDMSLLVSPSNWRVYVSVGWALCVLSRIGRQGRRWPPSDERAETACELLENGTWQKP